MTTMPGGAAVRSLQCGGEASPRNHLTPTISGTDGRGFVKLVPSELIALQAHLMTTADVSAAVAIADVGELLALLIGAADRTGRVAPPGGWKRDTRFGYHQHLIAADGWEPRRKRLLQAGILLADDFGRVLSLAPSWHRQLTDPRVRKPDGSDDQLPYVIVQRTEFAATVAKLQAQRDTRGRIKSGIARLLPLVLYLCTPGVGQGREGLLRPTQRELAATWQVSFQTVNKMVTQLRELEFVEEADVHRGPNARRQHLCRIGAFSDQLAGRQWVVADEAPQDPHPTSGEDVGDLALAGSAGDPMATDTGAARFEQPGHGIGALPNGAARPDELFQDHAASVPAPPPASEGLAGGFQLQTSLGTPNDGVEEAVSNPGGGQRFAQVPRWEPGPGTRHIEYTRHSVEHLPANAPALHELLDRYEGKAIGAGVRTTVRLELRAAEAAHARWVASGLLPAPAERDRLDTVARLARAADALVRLGIDVTPALVYEDPGPGSRWHRANGVLDPHLAVVLLAKRLQPFVGQARNDHRLVETSGNWRQRSETADDELGTTATEKVDLHALLAQVEASWSAAAADRRPVSMEQPRSLVWTPDA